MKTAIKGVCLITLGALLLAAFAISTVRAEEDKCFSQPRTVAAVEVMNPEAKQVWLRDDAAKKYLEAYNALGEVSNFKAEELLFVQPSGQAVIAFLFTTGKNCVSGRIFVDPKIHVMLLRLAGRGA